MLEFYFSYRGVLKRLCSGALGAEMDRIASYFSSLGYKRASAKIYLSRIARFGRFAAEHCCSGPRPINEVADLLGHDGTVRKGCGLATRRGRAPLPGRRRMTDFAVFLGEKVERYIELRRALGYAFDKQAGTLRAFVRHIERAELDAPATRTMALDFEPHCTPLAVTPVARRVACAQPMPAQADEAVEIFPPGCGRAVTEVPSQYPPVSPQVAGLLRTGRHWPAHGC